MGNRFMFLIVGFVFVLMLSVMAQIEIVSHFPESSWDDTSVLFRVTTNDVAICKYTDVEGRHFLDMEYFEETDSNIHRTLLTNLDEGDHTYYVGCENSSSNDLSETHKISFRVRLPPRAFIELDPSPPLRLGVISVELRTSKPVKATPSLSFSYDGTSYSPIPLTGSGSNWEGYFIVGDDVEEGVGSFRFSARDFYGVEGNEIVEGKLFVVDSVVPLLVGSVKAVGEEDRVVVEWHYIDENNFNVYRDENAGVDYTDYYVTTKSRNYVDYGVVKGETYYYRVSAVDEAGNVGPLSPEVHATALLEDISKKENRLSISLIGEVDRVLGLVYALEDEIDTIESNYGVLMNEEEKRFFEEIDLLGKLKSSKNQLKSLESELESYKNQDLNSDALDRKLQSVEVRMAAIEKATPEKVEISDSSDYDQKLILEDLKNFMRVKFADLTEKDITNNVEEIERLYQDLEVRTRLFRLAVTHMDGARDEYSFNEISIENSENTSLVLFVPKSVAGSVSEMFILNKDYEVLENDPVISFPEDTDKISFYIPGYLDFSDFNGMFVSHLLNEREDSLITGYSVFSDYGEGVVGLILLIVLLSFVTYYFISTRNMKTSIEQQSNFPQVVTINSNIRKALGVGDFRRVQSLYHDFLRFYSSLSFDDKRYVYPSILGIKQEIDKSTFQKILDAAENGLRQGDHGRARSFMGEAGKLYGAISQKLDRSVRKRYKLLSEMIK